MADIADIGPTPSSYVSSSPVRSGTGRILCLCLAGDGQRMYAGTFAGVWRSDDAGRNWRQMVRPQPGSFDAEVPGALFAPYVIDIAVSPADPNIVIAAAEGSLFQPPRNGLYRSADGGESWTLVQSLPPNHAVSQVVFAPDDPNLVMAPLGLRMAISRNAGLTWSLRLINGVNPAWHVAIGPLQPGGVRRAYAAGDNRIWRSTDEGQTWRADLGASVIRASRALTSAFIVANTPDGSGALPAFAARTSTGVSTAAQALAIAPDNPQHVFLATMGGTFGPSYFARKDGVPIPDGTACNTTPERLAGESSLWFGDFSNFDAVQSGFWQAVPGPPVYWGTTTPSGKVFVITKPTASGYLVFFADNSHVHLSAGRPLATTAWHRLDGRDASVARRMNALSNHVSVHPDPHALVVTSDFDVSLQAAAGVPSPYDLNSELDAHLGGTIWMANDGGVQWSDDGGVIWNSAHGLHTCDAINIAGLAKPGKPPALYIGTGDNDSFVSLDGGQTWRDCAVHLGDADAWFSDLAQSTRVLQFAPRGDGLDVWSGDYPNASNGGAKRGIPTPNSAPAGMGPHNASSGFVVRGYSPIVRTLATESAPADGDYVLIMAQSDATLALKRTLAISSITKAADWEDPAIAPQIGPNLPPGATVVQAAGGHANPVFYVSNSFFLWKLDAGGQDWRQIVPGGPPGRSAGLARRFYVDPFNPDLLYIQDVSRFRVSVDGGESWLDDAAFTRAMTGDGRLDISKPDLLRDMLFLRSNRFARFAFGAAGAMYTLDGFVWRALYNATAKPGLPEAGFFDGISDPNNRTLYVVVEGRGILRLSGVPAPPAPPQPGVTGLELAAILHEA